ncbi:MAG TPA: bifunctional DNA-formamidopyrimidine glycosylase/DNA-(apurinic or apyrimidinic site) lyase [Polyangia bacterium]|jgi:formamidopyrimidine-DNA glycosylase (fpg)|nr:bifunctional DNA-formamidopyrimidine glycosylase/DNA-(apurinic or apyrimidinic site) lyase [Polyangia bacterium]
MPELPEVETVVRTLRPRLLGASIAAVWTSDKGLRLARPVDRAALARLSAAARIAAVRRKGKYILIDLEGGQGGLLIHLGMSGRLRLQAASEPRAPHTHVVWSLAGGGELRFVDPRRFGWVAASRNVDALPELAGLGPDALGEMDVSRLRALLAASSAPLKSFLLDQKRIAGLGNIYVCEALFRSRLHPRTPARRAAGRAAALLRAIRATLKVALANRGTSLRDFVDSDGRSGENAAALLVYGREREPCRACGAPVRRSRDSGRSTFYCPSCQRR